MTEDIHPPQNEDMEVNTPQRQVLVWKKNAHMQQMSALTLPPPSPSKGYNIEWGKEVKRITYVPYPEGMMKVIEVDRALMLAPSASTVAQWKAQSTGTPSYEEVRVFTQGVIAPLDDKVRSLCGTLQECSTHVATLSQLSQQNVQNVFGELNAFWK